jgi:hypothetical protein
MYIQIVKIYSARLTFMINYVKYLLSKVIMSIMSIEWDHPEAFFGPRPTIMQWILGSD